MIDLIGESLAPELGEVGQRLLDLYEPVPESVGTADGRVLLCPVCGWTLARTARGTLTCGDQRCRDLSDGFQRVDGSMRFGPSLHRVRRAIRRYIVAPGRYEVDTAARLRKLKSRAGALAVDLWPSFDAYDLRITFPDLHVWAVDIKDWAFPTLLARALAALARDSDLAWDTAFYAIPDVRLERRPDYLTVLAAATPDRGFELCTLDMLVSQARDRLARLGAGGGKETADAQ
jgi:REase associating with pPIWI_RE